MTATNGNGLLPEELSVAEKIKELRTQKSLSLVELAERTGFSSALLSQVENYLISPPLGMLIKIAKALGVEICDFFSCESGEHLYQVVRANEGKRVVRVASKQGIKYGYAYESLAVNLRQRHMEPFLVMLEPATIRDRHAYSHEGEEFLFVLEGSVEIILDKKKESLEPGDCVYFHSIIPHCVQCCDETGAKLLAVIFPGED